EEDPDPDSSPTVVRRQEVPDDKVGWDVPWPAYDPPAYTSPHLAKQSWADPDIESVRKIFPGFHPTWNVIDGTVDRRSTFTEYLVVDDTPRYVAGGSSWFPLRFEPTRSRKNLGITQTFA
ncbi:unnamed protein product, partial [Darwinula stevensoni]